MEKSCAQQIDILFLIRSRYGWTMPSSAPVCNKDAYQQACAAEKSGDSPRFVEKVQCIWN